MGLSAQLCTKHQQAAVSTGNPLALTHLPPELADAAVAQWEKALSLAQQTAQVDDSAARAHLEQLRRETAHHAHAIAQREKDWDITARIRERALVEPRDQINVLVNELAADRGELRFCKARIADLEAQNDAYRQQLALVVTRGAKSRTADPEAAAYSATGAQAKGSNSCQKAPTIEAV